MLHINVDEQVVIGADHCNAFIQEQDFTIRRSTDLNVLFFNEYLAVIYSTISTWSSSVYSDLDFEAA